MKTSIMLLVVILFASCATVKIYSDEKATKEVGLKFYQPKPFMLVEYNPAKDVSIKTSIVYLPDLANPRYIKVTPGWGSSSATVGYANGVMNSFGAISDSKGPETITGLASAVTSLGGAALSLAQVDEITEKIELGLLGGEQGGGSAETIKNWKEQAKKLDLIIGEEIKIGPNTRLPQGLSVLKGHNDLDQEALVKIIKELKAQLDNIIVPRLALREKIIESLTETAKALRTLDLIETPARQDGQRSQDRYAAQIEEVVKAISEKKTTVKSHWELFEMEMNQGTLQFKKVKLPASENNIAKKKD